MRLPGRVAASLPLACAVLPLAISPAYAEAKLSYSCSADTLPETYVVPVMADTQAPAIVDAKRPFVIPDATITMSLPPDLRLQLTNRGAATVKGTIMASLGTSGPQQDIRFFYAATPLHDSASMTATANNISLTANDAASTNIELGKLVVTLKLSTVESTYIDALTMNCSPKDANPPAIDAVMAAGRPTAATAATTAAARQANAPTVKQAHKQESDGSSFGNIALTIGGVILGGAGLAVLWLDRRRRAAEQPHGR